MAGLRRETGPDRRRNRSAKHAKVTGACFRSGAGQGARPDRGPQGRRSEGGRAKGRRPQGGRQAPRHVAAVALSGQTYTIQSGDSLSKVAEKLNIAGGWQLLADANAATISNPDLVFPGQVLQLPA